MLQKTVSFWEWIRDTKAHVSGGVQEWLIAGESSGEPTTEDRDELFFSGEKEGRDKIDETCTVSDWMMLGMELYQATGEGRYLDAAEQIFFNHQLFDFASNGGWCGHRSLWGDAGCVWDFLLLASWPALPGGCAQVCGDCRGQPGGGQPVCAAGSPGQHGPRHSPSGYRAGAGHECGGDQIADRRPRASLRSVCVVRPGARRSRLRVRTGRPMAAWQFNATGGRA